MTLDQKRDAILSSLRDQFATKVAIIAFKGDRTTFDAFLLDLANNLAQAIAEED